MMKHLSLFALILPLTALVLLGCDYGHSGAYKVVWMRNEDPDSKSAVVSGGVEGPLGALEQALRELGYEQGEKYPKQWSKPSADVRIEPFGEVDWKLTLSKFGGPHQMRDAREAELELVRSLSAKPGLRVVWLRDRQR